MRYLPEIAKSFEKDEAVPESLKRKVRDINRQLAEWGARGSVRRSFAESKLVEARRQIIDEIGALRRERIRGLEDMIGNATGSYYREVEARPMVHLVRRERAQFEASIATDDDIARQLSGFITGRTPGEKVEGLDSYRFQALFAEARKRGLGLEMDIERHFREADMSLDMFDRTEIPACMEVIHRLEQVPDDVIEVVHHERGGEEMLVELDQLIDTSPLENLADPPPAPKDQWS